jgi:hypothetical protein
MPNDTGLTEEELTPEERGFFEEEGKKFLDLGMKKKAKKAKQEKKKPEPKVFTYGFPILAVVTFAVTLLCVPFFAQHNVVWPVFDGFLLTGVFITRKHPAILISLLLLIAFHIVLMFVLAQYH